MIHVRDATVDDVDAMIELRTAWTEERLGESPDPEFPTRFRAWFEAESAQRTFLLALWDDEPVGMINLLTFERMPRPGSDAGRWGYLGNMYVRPEHRNKGVGRVLIDMLIANADTAGLERIVLSPSERSIPFYARVGFSPANELLLRRRREV